MSKDDEDWDFPPEAVDRERYRGQSEDLSAMINQGQLLHDLRLLAGVSAQSLAEQAQLSHSELLAIEAGLMTLSKLQAVRLSVALEVGFTELWISPTS